MINFNILTLFPDMFPGILEQGVTGRALEKNLWSINTINIRDFSTDVHKTVDDTPSGGGAGMVLKPDLIEPAYASIPTPGKAIYLSPRGKPLNQSLVHELSQETQLTLLCGRYEGVDQRALDSCNFEEISMGDYVLSGGEIAAYALMDSIIRLIPGALGNKDTTGDESFENGLLEYPQYTRPTEWTDRNGKTWIVPDVLTSGHHKNIDDWRFEQSKELTKERRPDLWERYLKQKT